MWDSPIAYLTVCARQLSLCFSLILIASQAHAVDGVVVRPPQWSKALEKWKAYRASQGYELVELDSTLSQQQLTGELAELYKANTDSLKFVILVGDVQRDRKISIPTFYRKSTAMVRFGGDQQIATDAPYADFDHNDKPEVALGRIPADSPEQVANYLDRVIAYESNQDFSKWRRDVHIVAGVGGFGAVADSVIEMTTRRFLADRIPGWFELSMTQASLRSHYCPDPWRFSETCVSRMNQGGLLFVYIGHGHVKTLDYVRAGDEYLPIFNSDHVSLVKSRHPPIAVFLACYTGAIDASEDSLAEQLILTDNGPIAAIAASRVSGPYGLAMLSDGLLDNFFVDRKSSLGEIMLAAKQRQLQDESTDESSGKRSEDSRSDTQSRAKDSPNEDDRCYCFGT